MVASVLMADQECLHLLQDLLSLVVAVAVAVQKTMPQVLVELAAAVMVGVIQTQVHTQPLLLERLILAVVVVVGMVLPQAEVLVL
jgi:hypothetical protein